MPTPSPVSPKGDLMFPGHEGRIRVLECVLAFYYNENRYVKNKDFKIAMQFKLDQQKLAALAAVAAGAAPLPASEIMPSDLARYRTRKRLVLNHLRFLKYKIKDKAKMLIPIFIIFSRLLR